jgi:hypothetical protein
VNFKSALLEINTNIRRELCKSLACLAIQVPESRTLETILEVHGKKDIQWNFHAAFDQLKYSGADADADIIETVRDIENSEFESLVPEGKRLSDLHQLDYL